MTTKTEKPTSFATKTEKTDLKNSQNRKPENPNAPLFTHSWLLTSLGYVELHPP